MPRGEDLYHTGIVVEDFDQALNQLGEYTGHQFTEPMESSVSLRTPTGELTAELLVAYSCGPGPLIEVIKSVPGTPWQSVAGSGLHHLGYWVDDIDAESAALTAAGLPMEAQGLGPDGQVLYVYHYNEGGVRVELVDRAIKSMMDQWTSTPRQL